MFNGSVAEVTEELGTGQVRVSSVRAAFQRRADHESPPRTSARATADPLPSDMSFCTCWASSSVSLRPGFGGFGGFGGFSAITPRGLKFELLKCNFPPDPPRLPSGCGVFPI